MSSNAPLSGKDFDMFLPAVFANQIQNGFRNRECGKLCKRSKLYEVSQNFFYSQMMKFPKSKNRKIQLIEKYC